MGGPTGSSSLSPAPIQLDQNGKIPGAFFFMTYVAGPGTSNKGAKYSVLGYDPFITNNTNLAEAAKRYEQQQALPYYELLTPETGTPPAIKWQVDQTDVYFTGVYGAHPPSGTSFPLKSIPGFEQGIVMTYLNQGKDRKVRRRRADVTIPPQRAIIVGPSSLSAGNNSKAQYIPLVAGPTASIRPSGPLWVKQFDGIYLDWFATHATGVNYNATVLDDNGP